MSDYKTAEELTAKLYSNLRELAGEGYESSYTAGYLFYAIQDIANHGMTSLKSHVDYTESRLQRQRAAA